jgi:hypothetical protein
MHENMNNKSLWGGFLMDAETFLVSYLELDALSLRDTSLFLVGHSIELFLKAIYIEQTGDVNAAMNFRHNIMGLFKSCQKGSPPFMPKFEFKGTFEEMSKLSERANQNLTNGKSLIEGFSSIEEQNFLHFMKYSELYLIFENLANFKYANSPWPKKSSLFKYRVKTSPRSTPSHVLVEFAVKAEDYLGYNSSNIKEHFEKFELDDLRGNTRAWLSQIYNWQDKLID